MDLCSTTNAPRRCRLSGKTFFVRTLSIEGMATILAWLDDVIPGRAERTMPPTLGSPEAQEALKSWPGRFLLTWLAVRDSGISYDDACLLAFSDQDNPEDITEKDLEHFRVLDVLFSRRRTARDESDIPKQDIAATWCSESMAQLAREIGIEALGKLSSDQYAWLMSGGELDAHAGPAPGEVEQAEVASILSHARQTEGVDPAVIEAYERALKAFGATGEVIPDESAIQGVPG